MSVLAVIKFRLVSDFQVLPIPTILTIRVKLPSFYWLTLLDDLTMIHGALSWKSYIQQLPTSSMIPYIVVIIGRARRI